jgi:hypothetical protein
MFLQDSTEMKKLVENLTALLLAGIEIRFKTDRYILTF